MSWCNYWWLTGVYVCMCVCVWELCLLCLFVLKCYSLCCVGWFKCVVCWLVFFLFGPMGCFVLYDVWCDDGLFCVMMCVCAMCCLVCELYARICVCNTCAPCMFVCRWDILNLFSVVWDMFELFIIVVYDHVSRHCDVFCVRVRISRLWLILSDAYILRDASMFMVGLLLIYDVRLVALLCWVLIWCFVCVCAIALCYWHLIM